MAGEILKGIVEVLKLGLRASKCGSIGKVVIGTVQGDVHDIGKNIVVMLLEANEFEVVDLGVDVPPERFVEAIREHKPDIVGMSRLLTVVIESMKKTVDAIKKSL